MNLDKLQEAQLGEQGPWRPPCSCDFDSSGGAYKSEELSENELFSHTGSHVLFCTVLWFVSKVTFFEAPNSLVLLVLFEKCFDLFENNGQ